MTAAEFVRGMQALVRAQPTAAELAETLRRQRASGHRVVHVDPRHHLQTMISDVMTWIVVALCAPLIIVAAITPIVAFGMWLERQR